jgi:hypothetical protein
MIQHVGPFLRVLLTIIAALSVSVVAGATAPATKDGKRVEQQILKFDIMNRQYAPVTLDELRPGHIYSHYSPQLGRQVWSICKEDKTFWHALAAGSCQPVHLFDWNVRTEDEEKAAEEQLRKANPGIARQVAQEGAAIFLELHPDGHWRLTRTSVPSVYDAETGMRWEWQFGRYIPVRRTSDYGW